MSLVTEPHSNIAVPVEYAGSSETKSANPWWPLVLASLGFTFIGGCFCVPVFILIGMHTTEAKLWTGWAFGFVITMASCAALCLLVGATFTRLLLRHAFRVL
jgi:hypothetical protein